MKHGHVYRIVKILIGGDGNWEEGKREGGGAVALIEKQPIVQSKKQKTTRASRLAGVGRKARATGKPREKGRNGAA